MFLRILCLLLLVVPVSVEAETLTGKVVGVTDGDTITVLVAERTIKVRLAEIDTPERGQPWASRAKQAVSDEVGSIRVVVVNIRPDHTPKLALIDRDYMVQAISS